VILVKISGFDKDTRSIGKRNAQINASDGKACLPL
jgi:hypothetical protein